MLSMQPLLRGMNISESGASSILITYRLGAREIRKKHYPEGKIGEFELCTIYETPRLID